MACQAIGQPGYFLFGLFLVTAQAPAHIHYESRTCDGHRGHIAMTGLTGNSAADMRVMTEDDMIWLKLDRHPGDRLASLPVAKHLLHLLAIRGDDAVTANAALNGWYAGDI